MASRLEAVAFVLLGDKKLAGGIHGHWHGSETVDWGLLEDLLLVLPDGR